MPKSFIQRLHEVTAARASLLCLNLDPELRLLPSSIQRSPSPVWKFIQEILDATLPYLSAVKLNLAFYEVLGNKGWRIIERVLAYLPKSVIAIADGKRNDIGNTARLYAEAYFSTFSFDAITVNPLLGSDSVAPFLERPDRGTFILTLTSNPSAKDFQERRFGKRRLCDEIATKAVQWNTNHNVGLVVGATHAKDVRRLRRLAPELPFLIPGIGAQGGDLESAVRSSITVDGDGTLIAIGRAILYANSTSSFAEHAAREAEHFRNRINQAISRSTGTKEAY